MPESTHQDCGKLTDSVPLPQTPGHAMTAPLRRRSLLPFGARVVVGLSLAVALIVTVPVLSVGSSVFLPSDGTIAHLVETVLGEVVLNTIGLMLMVGLGVASVGVGTAWLVTMCRFPGSRVFEVLLLLPLAMPAYIIGYAYTDALAFAGPVQTLLRDLTGWTRADYLFPDIHSLWGVSLMLTLVLYPYVYLLSRTAFLDQSVCVLEASRTLGAGPWQAFRRVGLPMARPAVAAGVALALMEALADFGTVQYFGIQTFTTVIYRTWFGMGDRVAASQLATALLMVVFALVALELLSRRGETRMSARRHRIHTPLVLGGARAALAVVACALPVLLGFAAPVAALVRLHAEGGDPFFGPRFLIYIRNSFVLAGLSAVVIVLLAALVTYATRLVPGRATATIVRISSLGYAIPGTVIAVGILMPLGAVDAWLNAVMRALGSDAPGLLLSGSVIALLFAYLVRFMAVATGPLESGLGRIPSSLDAAARTLGSTAPAVAGRIHAPLMRRSLLTAGLVVFVDVLKELPATLIVRPFDFDTLAVRVYNLASDERLAQASTGALVIVAVGLVPVIVLTRMIASERARGSRGPS